MRGITFPSAFSWGDLFEEGGRVGKRVVRMEYSIVHMELVSQYTTLKIWGREFYFERRLINLNLENIHVEY